MDRRRFVPAPEGLEVRTMLASGGAGFSLLGSSTTTQTLPITFAQKELRIQKMPTNLRALQPDRYLPPATINQIQLGLNEIISQTQGADQLQPGDAQYRPQYLAQRGQRPDAQPYVQDGDDLNRYT